MKGITLIILLAISSTSYGAILPLHCDFNSDVPGFPPATGGEQEPSSLVLPPGGSIFVHAGTMELDDQPCVIDQGPGNSYGSIDFHFAPVIDHLLVYEATFSVSQFMTGMLMQTATDNGIVVSRFFAMDTGRLEDQFGTDLGQYLPNVPLRCRMTVNMVDENWDCLLDYEMDGFENDVAIEDLPFTNSASVIHDVSQALASLGYSGYGGVLVAYDNIDVYQQEYAPATGSSWSSLKALY
jgi:hypothetical protein